MDQIMRLRRAADHQEINDVNNGHRHMAAFTKLIEKKGTLDEAALLQESYAPGIKGKLKPPRGAVKGLIESLPTAVRGIKTGKMRSLPKLIPGVHHKLPGDAQSHIKRIYAHTEDHAVELNLYIRGEEVDQEAPEERVEPEPDEIADAESRPGTDTGLAPGAGS
jgi:succinate dehydrogenase / fumarate reductase iron-sulfur subunit